MKAMRIAMTNWFTSGNATKKTAGTDSSTLNFEPFGFQRLINKPVNFDSKLPTMAIIML